VSSIRVITASSGIGDNEVAGCGEEELFDREMSKDDPDSLNGTTGCIGVATGSADPNPGGAGGAGGAGGY